MNKLSVKLSLGILLLAAPAFILTLGALFLQSRYFIHQEAMRRANSTLNTTLQHMNVYMTTVETAANANLWLIEENFTPQSLQAVSRRIVSLNRNIHSCSISTEPDVFPQYGHSFSVFTVNDGDTIITVTEPDYDYFDKAWYKTALSSDNGCWVDPFSEYTDGAVDRNEAIATYCKPIRQEDGQPVGVVAVDMTFRKLAEIVNAAEQGFPNAYFMMIGSDGRYLIHRDTTKLFKKTIFTDADSKLHADMIALGHEMTDGRQGNIHVNINNQLCHVAYRPVPGTNWSLALICPDNGIMAGYHHLVYIIIAIIVVGLLVIVWLCYRGVRKTISPINRLLGITQKITQGNYSEDIQHSDREDVIGRLQNSFATMQQSLNFHIGSIRQTTEETRMRNEELTHAMKLAEEGIRQKNLFIQNVSHQIRTPLNIISGFAHVMREDCSTGGKKLSGVELEDITSMMRYNSSHLNRMILMLFDSSESGISEESRIQKTDRVKCNRVALNCIDDIQGSFPELKIRFETLLDDRISIRTNLLFLTRTLRELLYNSAKYSDCKHIALRVWDTDTTVCFTVEDTGPGLPEGREVYIFNLFTKIDDMTEGLGLGLPLCKRHANSLGGDLTYDTSYHNGCRFTLELPK